jgi:hypothetical protein
MYITYGKHDTGRKEKKYVETELVSCSETKYGWM